MKRLDQLTQLTAAQLAQDDIIGIRDQSAGQTKYITVRDLTGSPEFGWAATAESWAYSSWNATTKIGVITVPTDATTKYSVGMKIRLAQTTGGTKYGIITAVTATTLSVWFSSLYTLNNEAITAPVYTSAKTPLGFPTTGVEWELGEWLSWTPTKVGWSSFTVELFRYTKIGKTVTIEVDVHGTSNSTSASITLPWPAYMPVANSFKGVAIWTPTDNGSGSLDVGRAYIASTSTSTLIIEKNLAGGVWTASGTKGVRFTMTYEAA